ncbi:DNA repair protein RecO [Mycoplasmopsis felifaucium]|uniref:DNA repair protein RecO n=1 Tax=Mycoplasmopsis felifaucium TaxID=35768 RepID=UPI00048335D7|nr:recombination protein O N-terminal domain-containing protein [Mycoplasmopsis felifaucium]
MAEVIEKVVVLELKPYAENTNDAILYALTKNGVKAFLAKGVNKSESKNRANLQIGSVCEIEYFPTRLLDRVNRLKKANIIAMPNYENRFVIKFVSKAVIFMKHFNKYCPEITQAYEECLKHQNDGKTAFLVTYLVASALKYYGIMPNIERCIECGSPGNLCSFQFYLGGYFCGLHTKKQRWTKELKSIYYLFKNLSVYLNVCIPSVNEIIYKELLAHYISNGICVDWEKDINVK